MPKKLKDGAYVINFDEYAVVGLHWIALFCKKSETVYLDSFGVEYVPEEIKKFIENKNIKANIFRLQSNNSITCGYFYMGFIDFMFACKKVTDFTSFFSPYVFEKNDSIIVNYFKDEWNWQNKFDWTKFRLNEINKIENYFNSEINQRKLCCKKLSKYVTAFDYKDKILIVLPATTGKVCIVSHATIVGAPVGIASAGFTIVFSLATGIIKKLLSTTRNKKKKHDKIIMLAKSKLNSIETLVSQALIDIEINHEEFITTLKAKDKYVKMKENVRNVSEKLKEKAENMRLNSVNSRTWKNPKLVDNLYKWWLWPVKKFVGLKCFFFVYV